MLTACSVCPAPRPWGWPCNPFWCKILHGLTHMCSDLLGQTQLLQRQRQQVCLPHLPPPLFVAPSKSLAQGTGGWQGDGREVQEGGDVCVAVADSCGCLSETNKIL